MTDNIRLVAIERHGVVGGYEWFEYRGHRFATEQAARQAASDLAPVLEAVEDAMG